jgi:hypothetical protein
MMNTKASAGTRPSKPGASAIEPDTLRPAGGVRRIAAPAVRSAQGRWTGLSQSPVTRALIPTLFATALGLHLASAVIGVGELVRGGRMLRYGKTCLLFIDVHANDRCLSEWVYRDIPALRKNARALEQLGYLRPGLIGTARLQDLRPGAATVGVGVFELFSEKRARYVAEGWAGLPEGDGPADAVVLAVQAPDGDWVPEGFAPVLSLRPDVASARGRAYRHSGWTASASFAGDRP